MAKVKVINRRQGSDLIGANFKNEASETIFTFGSFSVGSNFAVRTVKDYSNELSSFVTPISLDTLNVSVKDSASIFNYNQSVVLNIDKSDLTSYARFGSLEQILTVSVQNIIAQFPASVYITYQVSSFNNLSSVTNYSFNPLTNLSRFTIPVPTVVNNFGIILTKGNLQVPPTNPALGNLNLSFYNYEIWRSTNPTGDSNIILGYTGFTSTYPFLTLVVSGNTFPELSATTQGQFNYHIKPQPLYFNKFKKNLTTLESYLINEKITGSTGGYQTEFQTPTQLDDGSVVYGNQKILWSASDGYNIDTSGFNYNLFLSKLSSIGQIFDQFKADIVARILVPESMISNDLTENGKVQELLRLYGSTFDNIKVYIDALVTINKLSYDKKQNIPDVLVKNFARTLGWDVVTLVTEDDLLSSFFSTEQKASTDLLPPEVDIELWRRILINTNYLFKTKGTREAIRTMFLMVGIPEPFINITEYVYTVNGPINPNTVQFTLADLPSASLPYDTSGYPVAPKESSSFYFQVSGNTDGGQAYMNNFRNVGFVLNRTIDNKKSWIQTGQTVRIDPSSPDYFQLDSKLVLNTKEVDVTLDIARGIEFDVYRYNVEHNFPLSSTGVTTPYLYINIPFTYGVSANTFTIPEIPQGDIQVSFNGITLEKGNSPSDPIADYYINPFNLQQVILKNGVAKSYSNGSKDIITLTYAKDQLSGSTYADIIYVVTKINSTPDGMTIPLIETPLGEIQLVVDGITMTKSSTLFTGDYVINPANPLEILIVNNALVNYLTNNPIVTISYIKSINNDPIFKKSEVYQIHSFSGTKFYYNAGIQKYVYVLDYEPPDVKAVKIAINGLTLQNGTDFILNSSNRKQVLFNTSYLGLGYVINAFYVTTNSSAVPINFGNYAFPNLSQISFLQYLYIINYRLINVKNRKTITNNEGGIYPTVQKLYEEYLKRAFANPPIPRSNGYTFGNVYPFINKFNSFYHRFIDQLLSATIILNKGGVLIRNTDFTKQKFKYRRGVNFDTTLMYLGDDGSEFRKRVSSTTNSFVWSGLTCVYFTPPLTTTTTIAPKYVTLKITLNSGGVLQDNSWGLSTNSTLSSAIVVTQHPQAPYISQVSSSQQLIATNGTPFQIYYGKITNGNVTQYGGNVSIKQNGSQLSNVIFNIGDMVKPPTGQYLFSSVSNGDVLEIVVNEDIAATTTTTITAAPTTTTTTAAPTTTTTTTFPPWSIGGVAWGNTYVAPYKAAAGFTSSGTRYRYEIISVFGVRSTDILTFKVDDSFYGFGNPTIQYNITTPLVPHVTDPTTLTYTTIADQGTFTTNPTYYNFAPFDTAKLQGEVTIYVKISQNPAASVGSTFSVRWSLISSSIGGAITNTFVDLGA